jgi:hypothetical protein
VDLSRIDETLLDSLMPFQREGIWYVLSVREYHSLLYIYVHYSQKPQEALNQLVTEECYRALFYMPLYTFLHNLLNVLVKIANKMGLQKKIIAVACSCGVVIQVLHF